MEEVKKEVLNNKQYILKTFINGQYWFYLGHLVTDLLYGIIHQKNKYICIFD